MANYTKRTDLFKQGRCTCICAPMVRYSKLSFRTLVRKYGCDLAFTPMIVSNTFVKSIKARDMDFTTDSGDRPLIVQFAASNGKDFADAAEIVVPYADGVDLNCGCPQRWAMQEGYGACLINKPEMLSDMVRQARSRVADPQFTVSIKIRIHNNVRQTVSMCRQVEQCGISWVSVHGRTAEQRGQPVNTEAIRLVKENLAIPVVANGDVRSMQDAAKVTRLTGVDGVMAARGILANPAMFAGFEHTPLQCVKDWLDISLSQGTTFHIFHQHLIRMLEPITSKAEQHVFNCLYSTPAVLDYLSEHYSL